MIAGQVTRDMVAQWPTVIARHGCVGSACQEIGVAESTMRRNFARFGFGKPSDYISASGTDSAQNTPPAAPRSPSDRMAGGLFSSGDECPVRSAVDHPVEPHYELADQPAWLHRLLVVPDTHAPFHDEQAWACMVAAARIIQPTIVIVLGDFWDCYSASEHDKAPGRASGVAAELRAGDVLLRQLDDLLPHRKVLIQGNHEYRLERKVMRHAPALHGMVPTIDQFLGLSDRGWEVLAYRDGLQLGDTYYTHDLERAGLGAVRHARLDHGGKIVIGHVHRIETVHAGDREGVPMFGRCFGWLGGPRAADYRHVRRAAKDYHLGFGWGYLAPDGTTWLHAATIERGRCEVMGRVVEAREAA